MRLASLFLLIAASRSLGGQGPTIDIERTAPNRWRAAYHLSSPATSLRFERPASFFRERVWAVVTPGYRLAHQGDQEVVTLDSGATPKTDIVFEFPEFTDDLPKEYEFFQSFTDGGVAIYTGHFYATSFGVAAYDSSTIRELRLRTPDGSHAVLRGSVAEGTIEFRDSVGEGTYIYMGHATPIETPDVLAIVDPGMPAWLKQMFDKNLPLLFHEYATRFGIALPRKPVVLFSYDSIGSGFSSSGGTLTGLLNMVLTGSAWRHESRAAAEQAFHLIAHESAHLWNGQLAHNVDEDRDAWMHEGSADAMANEMLRRFDIVDSARYRAAREEALNKCAAAVTSGSVETAIKRGAVRAAYDCGFMMAMWTDAAERAARPGADLFTFWRALIARGRRNRERYDLSLYFDVLMSTGVSSSVADRMRAFLANRDSMTIAIAGFGAAGVPVQASRETPPVSFQQDLARSTMAHLMSQACNRMNFYAGVPLRTAAIATCAPFVTEHHVYRIQNLRVSDQGAALYDAVGAACAAKTDVLLQDDAGQMIVAVPCTRTLVARPPWFVFVAR